MKISTKKLKQIIEDEEWCDPNVIAVAKELLITRKALQTYITTHKVKEILQLAGY